MNELPVTYGIVNDDSSDPIPPSIVLTDITLPNTVLNKADAIINFTATSSDNSDIQVRWTLNDEVIETDVKASGSEFSYNFKELLLPSYVNKIKMEASTLSGGSLICDWTISSRDTFITLENLERFKANLEGLFGKTEGIATLDINGKIPENQVTAEAFNVKEYDTYQQFPAQGRWRTIYIDKATNNLYRWDTATSKYVNTSSPDSVKYTEQTLTEEQQEQARHNIGAISAEEVPSGESVLYVPQELNEQQQIQARANINAAAADAVPANAVLYTEQTLSTEEKVQARTNIDAVSNNEITGVVKYTVQAPTGEEKTIARTNIGAASQSSLDTLTGVVDEINGRINNWGDFVREVNSTEDGIEVVYDEAEAEIIPTGLIFNGGYVDENNELYLKQDDTVLPSDVFTPIKLPKGGGGGGGSDITLTDVVRPTSVRNGEDAVISFVATASDGEDLTVRWTVNGQLVATQIDSSGSTFSYNFKDVFKPSFANKVRLEIESASGASISPRNWTITTVAFAIEWGNSIEPIMLNNLDANVYAPIIVSAETGSENVVTVTINSHTITRNTKGSVSITVALDKEYFNPGINIVTASMHSAADTSDRAKDISFKMIWGIGVTTPVVAFVDTVLNCDQYDLIDIKYFVFDPNNEIANYTLRIGSDIKQLTAERKLQKYPYSPSINGNIIVALTCGESYTTMTIIAKKVDYDLGYYRDDSLLYVLDPVGHSNSDADREQFAGLNFNPDNLQNPPAFDWVNGGFQTSSEGAPAFVVKKGNKVALPRCLFEDSDTNGKTVDISFKVVNSDQYDAVAMQELNNDGTKGIILKSNNGDLRLNNVVGKEFRYCENSRIDLSLLVENNVDERIITIWLDGIPSSVYKYTEANMLVQNAKKLVIGSEHCDVWLYGIRVYNSNLTKTNMIQNYVSNGNTTVEKVSRYQTNTILDATEHISIDALHRAVPNLTIVHIHTERITTSKSDPVPANIEIIDGTEVLELEAASGPETGDGTVYKVQGTSSAAYGRSSYNLDLDFKGTGKKYKISDNSIPVNYINIKVNVASAENANNVNAVDWYNIHQPYITEPRTRPGVRDTVESKPCAVFFTNTSNEAKWFSSILVEPNETVLYAMGDLCNSKKNKEVFGQDGSGEHPTKCCIEVSGNDTEPECFRSTAAVFNPDADDGDGRWETEEWDEEEQKWVKIKHFEWRMKPAKADKTAVVAAWDELVAWVVSTIDNPAKFRNEIGDYFALDSMLYHFLFIEYFAGYDNVSKNTFYSYDWDENAQKYLWNIKCAYDMDTILACDNDGKPFGDYGLDYGDTVNGQPDGRSYFNAVTNTIWVNLKSAFQTELSSMYISLRARGAWNAQNIMNKWDTYQDKRPHVSMVLDAYTKYILPYKTTDVIVGTETKSHDDSYLPRLQGSKTYWRKQFLTYQTSYMDGKYGYFDTTNTFNFRTNGSAGKKSFTVKSYAKTYITFIVDSNRVGSKKVQAGSTIVFDNISVGNNTTLYITPDRLIQYVRPLNETQNSTFVAPGAEKLMEVMLGGDRVNNDWPSGTGLTIPSVLLNDLSIRNMPNFTDALNLSGNVELKTLDTRNTRTGMITLPSFAPLTDIQLNACTGISMSNLNKVETFTIENGSNLTSIKVENCNDIVSTCLATALVQAVGSESAAERRIRAIGINWNYEEIDAVATVASDWKGYNALGEEQDKSVVTGVITVKNLSQKKLEIINKYWGDGVVENTNNYLEDETTEQGIKHKWVYGDLIIYYTNLKPYYAVTFWNYNKLEKIKDRNGNDYIQYVDNGGNVYNPIPKDIDTPTYIDPIGQYRYTFREWDELPEGVSAPMDVTALYDYEPITYTVRWYDEPGGNLLDSAEGVEYGNEVVYNAELGLPEMHDEESAGWYKVFTGWDKSTGFITKDLEVYAVWERAQLPPVGTKLMNMNVAQIAAIAAQDKAETYFSDKNYTDIIAGHDFDFSNVESEVLLENRYFDGTQIVRKPSVKLFDEDSPSFTLAFDYEYAKASSNASIINCCDNEGGSEGFKVQYVIDTGNQNNNHGIKVSWGNNEAIVAHGLSRGIIVLRHRKGSNTLTIASSNEGRYIYPRNSSYGNDEPWPSRNAYTDDMYAGYNPEIYFDSIARTQSTQTDGCLCFGAVPWQSSIEIGSQAKGWIHWCKIWYDDIGENNIRLLASWPHETWRMRYRGHGLYNKVGSQGGPDAASFIAEAPLSLYYRFYDTPPSNPNTIGGWRESLVRAFVNRRCFNALPYAWQSLIKPVRIATKGGADNPMNIEYTTDKIYVPAYADLFSTTSGVIANEGTQISWITEPQYRVKHMGIIVPDDNTRIVNVPDDPTLYSEVYHLKDGDIWIKSNNPNAPSVAYVYFTQQTAERHGLLAGRSVSDNVNNIVAQGPAGGLWVSSTSYFTRTNSATRNASGVENKDWHHAVSIKGEDAGIWVSASYQERGIVLMFSI